MKLLRILFFSFMMLTALNGFSSIILEKGDQFFPFSLISTHNIVVTVTLEEGRLTVIKEIPGEGEAGTIKSNPDAVLIDFWATWCVPCRKAMPHMQELHETYKPKEGQTEGGLELIGIALDKKGNRVVAPFYNKLKQFTYLLLADPTEGEDDSILRTNDIMSEKYGAQAIPVVYIVDSKGIIQHAHIGFKKKDIEDLKQVLDRLVNGG